MPSIGEYADLVKLVLGETAKYLALLVCTVVSIRLWRRLSKVTGSNRRWTACLASTLSLATGAIGYFGMNHSLSLLYSSYGMRAFHNGNMNAALSLFQQSESHWKSADNLGQEGVCLLLLAQPAEGERKIEEAQRLRKGLSSTFEVHYSGVYYFLNEEPDKAFPLLQASSEFPEYRWNSLKLLAVILVEKNQAHDAAELMEPFAQARITDCEQAYVIASIKLQENKPLEAKTALALFPDDALPGFWKARFDKLRAKIQSLPS